MLLVDPWKDAADVTWLDAADLQRLGSVTTGCYWAYCCRDV